MGTARYFPQSFESAPLKAPLTARGLAYIVTGVAVLSAFTVFLSLCERDHSLLLSATGQEHRTSIENSAIPRLPIAPAETHPASDAVTRVTVPTVSIVQPPPALVIPSESSTVVARSHTELIALERQGVRHYVEFSLARSKRLQRVGPVAVGVWKVDAKRKLYDVSVVADGHRVDRRRVSLNSPVSISTSEFARPLELVVNAIDRYGISGYLSEPQSSR